MVETTTATVHLHETSYPVFLALVRFMYTDKLPEPADPKDLLMPLLEQAEKLGMPRLSQLCQQRLEQNLRDDVSDYRSPARPRPIPFRHCPALPY